MKITSEITVGNNCELNCSALRVETRCIGFIRLEIPAHLTHNNQPLIIELKRTELREFLARTCPAFSTEEKYQADGGPLSERLSAGHLASIHREIARTEPTAPAPATDAP